MNLDIENKLFIVTGASDGLGFAVTKTLLEEKANVIAVARTQKRLEELSVFKNQLEIFFQDVYSSIFPGELTRIIGERSLHGIFINAGGPPAGTFGEISLPDWDKAYQMLLRWKVDVLQSLLPLFRERHYGRILFSESVSVKQPIPNLILSNSLRAAVAGMAKTLASEVAGDNITVNVIAPGYHETHAMQRLFENKMRNEGITLEEAKAGFEKNIPAGRMGTTEEFGKLAAWLLSPLSSYITGQTISADGGVVKGIFG